MVETSLWIVALGVMMVGCGRSGPSETKPERPTAQELESGRAAERRTAPLAQNPRDIHALFQNEAAHRPGGGLRAEAVLTAFREGGIELRNEQQHLARPYGARYCVGALIGEDLALSVCEYTDADAAQAGATVSRKIPLKNRAIHVNRATSLTIRQVNETASGEALERELFQVFAAL